jgi:hypothetical protein
MRRLILAAAVAVVCIGCGGGSGGGGGGNPVSPAPAPVNETHAGNVGVFGTTRHPLSISRSGTLTMRVSWTGGMDLDLYLAPNSCVNLYPMSACGLLASADGLANPEVITRTVNQGESFNVFVDNLSTTQSANYTLTVNIQ